MSGTSSILTPSDGLPRMPEAGSPLTLRIAVLAGDGIGKEVVPPAVALTEAAGSRHGLRFAWDHHDWGCDRYLTTGRFMPPDALAQLAACDAILLGAVGDPRVPDHQSLWGMLIPIRRGFSQRVNVRPIRRLPGIQGPLRSERPIDYVVIRENVEGEYSEIGGRLYHGTADEIAVQESVFTRRGVEAVMRYAFDLASSRARTLVAATKSNGIIHTMPFWDQIFGELAAQYPAVATRKVHVDALAAELILRPEVHDVIVASNLFGDILTDLGAAVVGGIGLGPSGNIDPSRQHPPMFEAIHGSAPDIAGRGIGNPIATCWSAAMMLEHLEHGEAAGDMMRAIETVTASGEVLTPDLGGTATTVAVGEALIAALP